MKPKYQSFYFHKFKILLKENKIIFEYSFDKKLFFRPEIKLDLSSLKNTKKIELAVFNLGMAMLISYYKAYCPQEIIIEAGYLNKKQIQFWQKLYENGLMQFFYTNKINFKNLINIKVTNQKKYSSPKLLKNKKVLLPIGGGKDSLVSAEILKEKKIDFTWFYIKQHQKLNQRIKKLIKISNNTKILILENNTEKNFKKIIKLNQQDAYNGHIPITSIYIFSSVLTAVLHDFNHIDFSNEKSADEENAKFQGKKVLHAYAKSSEFEKDVQNYLKKNISSNLHFQSVLRNFSGIEIMKKFSKYPQYFNTFISCNPGLKTGNWCGQCPKCAYVFLGMSAFTNQKTVLNIFNKNLLSEKKLQPLFQELIGQKNIKPLDCVGTISENQQLYQLAQKTWSKKIAIIGFGAEGKILYKYLHKNFPQSKIEIFADFPTVVPTGIKFHQHLNIPANFDICYKSPGVSTKKIKLKSKNTEINTLTNLILEKISGKVIGITGTAGKTTTSSLIAFILQENKFDVSLIGNVGNSDINKILKDDHHKKFYVFEMSSYQCEFLKQSPEIAVILNIFQAHIKQHGSFEEYKRAKEKIFMFQKEGDYLLTPEKIEIEYQKQKFKTKLLGEHNQKNCFAAFNICQKIGISEKNILKAIKKFQPLENRLEKVIVKNKIIFYDDAMSSLPESTWASIKSLKKVNTIILGGQNNHLNYENFAQQLADSDISNFIIFPGVAEKMITKVKKNKKQRIFIAQNMNEAIKLSFQHTAKNKICLLSTAASSFGLFKNFKDKSKQYKNAIYKFNK